MLLDINQNPILTNLAEFKKLQLGQRRQVLYSMIQELLPLVEKVDNLEDKLVDIECKIEEIEDKEICRALNIKHTDFDEESITYPDETFIKQQRLESKRVTLNVGGKRFQALWSQLSRHPKTRLGQLCSANSHQELLKICDSYNHEEYFFDANPRTFASILNFYATGQLHLMDEVCVMAFAEDLLFWGIDELLMEPCCQSKYNLRRDALVEEMKKEMSYIQKEEPEIFPDTRIGNAMRMIWDLMEKPETSLGARIISFISISFIILSTIGMCINTIPVIAGVNEENEELALLELICIIWFTIEYVVRFVGAPRKWAFLKNGMNLIDILAILPYFISILLIQVFGEGQSLEDVKMVVQIFRIMRFLRIFKLARHSKGLQSMVQTLKNSYNELGMLLLFLTLSDLVFSSLCYLSEMDEEGTEFKSILHSAWWALITMTAVGYGDMAPTTGWGKLVGASCAITGVLLMAMPIPIIFNNFAKSYKELIRREKALKRKAAQEETKKKVAAIEQGLLAEAKARSNQVTAVGYRKRRKTLYQVAPMLNQTWE